VTDLGESLAHAIATKDADALRGLLHPEVEFRAVTPSRFWEADSADEVIDEVILGRWFSPADRIDAVERVEHDTVADRERVGYRFRVRREDREFLVEQQAYFHAHEGRIDWLRVMCAGYQPVD